MAYNPTRKRSVGVRPVGSVSMDGLRQIGASFENLGKAAVGISDTIEKSQLEEALLDGASRGASHGVSYETTENGEKVLKPFVSGSIDDLIGNLRPSSARAVREAYDKAAKSTYLSALTMDAQQQAQNAFLKNEFSPDKILETQNKYIENLRDKSDNDDVINMAMPNILAHWTGARNKALFSVRKQATAQATAVHDARLQSIANQHSAIVSSGADFSLQNQAIKALDAERTSIYESLGVLSGVDEKGIELLNIGHNTVVQSTVTKTEVSRLFREKGAEETISMIMDLQKTIATNDNVNGNEIIKAAEEQLRAEQSLLAQQTLDKNKTIKDLADLVGYKIFLGEIKTQQQIYDAGIKPGSAEALTALYRLENRKQTDANVRNTAKSIKDKKDAEEFNTNLLYFEYPETIPADFNGSKATIYYDMVDGFRSGKYKAAQLSRFITTQKALMQKELKSANKNKMINIQMNMSPSSGYLTPPSVFDNLTTQLLSEGIVGNGDGNAITLTAWEGKLSAYRTGFDKAQKDRIILKGINDKIDQGIPLDNTDAKHAQELGLIPTRLPNGKDLNIYDQNPTTADLSSDGRQSMDIAVAFSVSSGMLHPQLKPIMAGAKWLNDEKDFQRALSVHNQIANSLMMQGMSEGHIEMFFENAGVDISLLNSDTRYYSMDQIRFMQTDTSKGASRKISEIFPSRGDENEIREFYFNEAMQGDFVKNLINDFSALYESPSLSVAQTANMTSEMRPEHIKMIEMLESNGLSVEDALLNDPRLSKMIFEGAEIDLSRGRFASNDKGYKLAIRNNVTRLMSIMGLEENDDGDVEFVFHPVLREAQKSASEFPNVTPTQEDINQNITDVLRATPMATSKGGIVQKTIMEAMENGEYKLVPNTIYGKDITYSVYTQTEDGENVLLLPSYRYDFKKSAQYKAFNDALNEIKNNSLKKMMITLPLLNDTVMTATYNAVNNYNRSEETFAELKKAYNRAGYAIFGFNNFNELEIGKDDKARMLSMLLTLGIR